MGIAEIKKNTEKGYYDPKMVDVLFEILRSGTATP